MAYRFAQMRLGNCLIAEGDGSLDMYGWVYWGV